MFLQLRFGELKLGLQRVLGLLLDPLDEDVAGGDVVDEPDDLAGGPDAVVRVAAGEDLAAALAADEGGDLGELAGLALALDLDDGVGDLVAVEAGRVGPATHDQRRVGLLSLDDLLLDLLVDRRLHRAHEPRAHVDALRAETERGREALAIGEAARGDKGHLERLSCLVEQNEVGDVGLTNVSF